MTGSAAGLLRGDEARAQSSDPLMRVRADLLGPDLPPMRGDLAVPVKFLRDAGWTEAVYRRLAGLARHAIEVGAFAGDPRNDALDHLLRRVGESGPVTEARLLGVAMLDLFRLGEFSTWQGARLVEAEAWLTVYACTVNEDEAVRLRYGIGGWGSDNPPVRLDTWSTVSGGLAAFAFAAGLTPVEAEARHAVGTLDIDGLVTLAALRGWRFPPLALPGRPIVEA